MKKRDFILGAGAAIFGAANALAETAKKGAGATPEFDDNQKCVKVADFGAVGDGKTDDSQAVKKSVEAAAKNKVPLFFSKGKYLCGGIDLPAKIVVSAETGSVKIICPPSASFVFNAGDSACVKIFGISFFGAENATAKSSAIVSTGAKNLTIRNCGFENFSGDGIALKSAGLALTSCRCALNGGFGAALSGENISVSGCEFYENTSAGLLIESVKNATVCANSFYGNGKIRGAQMPQNDSCHAKFASCDGLSVSGNSAGAGKSSGGVWYPLYVFSCRDCNYSTIVANSSYKGFTNQFIYNLGGCYNSFLVAYNSFYQGGD